MTPPQAFEILLNIPEPRRTLVLSDAATALRVSEILGLMWMDLNFDELVIRVRRAYVWGRFKMPKSKASKAPVPMHPLLAGFLLAWRDKTPYAKEDDFVFPSTRLKGKKPLSASILVQKYLRPAAVKAGVVVEGQKIRFGFHNFRHSLASALVKMKVDPKTVQEILAQGACHYHAPALCPIGYGVETGCAGQGLGANCWATEFISSRNEFSDYLGWSLG